MLSQDHLDAGTIDQTDLELTGRCLQVVHGNHELGSDRFGRFGRRIDVPPIGSSARSTYPSSFISRMKSVSPAWYIVFPSTVNRLSHTLSFLVEYEPLEAKVVRVNYFDLHPADILFLARLGDNDMVDRSELLHDLLWRDDDGGVAREVPHCRFWKWSGWEWVMGMRSALSFISGP